MSGNTPPLRTHSVLVHKDGKYQGHVGREGRIVRLKIFTLQFTEEEAGKAATQLAADNPEYTFKPALTWPERKRKDAP